MGKEIFGFDRPDSRSLIGLLGGGIQIGTRRADELSNWSLFIARTPGGGVPAATGSWPTITVYPTQCDLAWVNESNILGPMLDSNSDPVTDEICQIAPADCGGNKLVVCIREFFGYKNVIIWELC